MVAKTETPNGIPDLKQTEVADAKKEGALDYIKDGQKAAMASDTGTTGNAEESAERLRKQIAPDLNTTFIAGLLDLAPSEFTRRLKPKEDDAIDFETAKGLMALERSGRNRTNYVKALLVAIDAKSPYEVTSAGPPYTNDESNITEL